MSTRQIDQFVRWNPQTNQYEMVLWRREILPSWLTIRDTDANLPIVVPAAPGSTPPLTIFQPYTSSGGADAGFGTPFEVRSLVFQDSGDEGTGGAQFSVMLKDVGRAFQFMNQPCHIRTIAGTGQFPAILREPYMFLSQNNVSAQFFKTEGASAPMRFYFCGAQYYPWSPMMIQYPQDKAELTKLLSKWMNRRKDVAPYWLTTEDQSQPVGGGITIPGGGQFVTTIKVGDAFQFEAFGHAAVSTGDFTLTVQEMKTNQLLMNGAISQVNGIGDSRLPTVYPTPYLMPAGYRLQLTFNDLTGSPNNVFFTWFGRAISAPISQEPAVLNKSAVPTPADKPSFMVPAPLSGMGRMRRFVGARR